MKHSNARDAVAAAVTPDILRRLEAYVVLLERWQPRLNLVAPSTMPDVWSRHIADSLQVQAAVPDAQRWLDLGSGGGFPGLVTAILLADTPGARVDLVESDKRKAAFLATVSRETGAPAHIHALRIEHYVPPPGFAYDAVSARALAPLPQLIAYAAPYLLAGATGVFPKGQGVGNELTLVERDNRFRFDSVASRVRDGSQLVLVRAATGGGDR